MERFPSMKNEQIILSIETGVCGGSISLLKGHTEIDYWVGTDKVSKADDILEQISELFTKNNVKKHQIDLIAVSSGPGSRTGIRIGLALSMGLKKASDCLLINVPVLKAMQLKVKLEGSENTVIAAVPISSSQIGWQIFKSDNSKETFVGQPYYSTTEAFIKELKPLKNSVLVVQENLYVEINNLLINTRHSSIRVDTENNLARWVGLLGKQKGRI